MHPNWYTNNLKSLCQTLEQRFPPEQQQQAACDLVVQVLITTGIDNQADAVKTIIDALAETGAGDMFRDALFDAFEEGVSDAR